MAEIIKMPKLSDTMISGKIIKWHKKVGDKIVEGDILADIETDKAIQEFESDINGTLLYIGVKENEITNVDKILAIIGNENENINNIIQKNNNNSNSELNHNKRIFASPLAKKIALENNISLNILQGSGSGENGRIIKKDINNIKQYINTNIEVKKTNKTVKHSSVRKVMIDRLIKSKFTIPNYYLTIDINMDNIILAKNNINKKNINYKISFNDFIVKAVSLALKDNIEINASWDEEKIIYYSNINIGIVVSSNNGLFVPVIYEVDKKSLKEISIDIKNKANLVRSGKIKNQDMEGSTITISNLGMFGINSFTSIINEPNACIISVGSIYETPIVKNGVICIGNKLKITLSCDHRIIDGVIASKFLKSIKNFLENPIFMIY